MCSLRQVHQALFDKLREPAGSYAEPVEAYHFMITMAKDAM